MRQIREERLLTQEALAKSARVCVKTLSSIENGLGCSASTRRRLLEALGIPIEQAEEVFASKRRVRP